MRAFGTEAYEEKSYKVATREALRKGVKDAYAGAGAYALTNYIDLGISVLLLWYGGAVVMAEDGRLTIGNLITFQLYWYFASATRACLRFVVSRVGVSS